ncbi:tumor necrosis factor receptor superfamily member 14-like [Montipora foliosa]|uniref:tumor necrosis factor receptor superfamily member 14-like n=1 Tax=Montipora foliosa TaxID=591990 RepID=UPI0035F19704
MNVVMSALFGNKATFVLIVSFSCLNTMLHLVSGQVTSERRCRWNQLKMLFPKGIECRNCPECPEGLGLVPQCGSRITTDEAVECTECQEGKSYSDTHDISSCKPCTICDPNEETISPCTRTKNAICGTCNAGYYRAVTGDCQPCSWCCADSRDDDKERECMEQSGLPANRVCRYDVDTMKCAPDVNETTSLVHPTSTVKSIKKYEVATHVMKEGTMNSKLWLLALIGFLALAMCSLVGLMYIYRMKNVVVANPLWKFCVTKRSSQEQSCNAPPSSIVFGRTERSEVVAEEFSKNGKDGRHYV